MSCLNILTPVVFLVFNRPATTLKVIERIRAVQPQKLLVVADGPRSKVPSDAERCAAVRNIINKEIDWKCEVITNYANSNMGCGKRISSGLDWAFSEVSEAIILEDDCIPHPSFFKFCEELLQKFRQDERVMHISGDNFLPTHLLRKESYRFSLFPHVWGWASWARAWKNYKFSLDELTPQKQQIISKFSIFPDYWLGVYKNLRNGVIDTWDFQWLFSCIFNDGLAVLPNVNLVENIGFGMDSTHTKASSSKFGKHLSHNLEFPLIHPNQVVRDIEADKETEINHYGLKLHRRMLYKLNNWLDV